jgi:hypothetical protein
MRVAVCWLPAAVVSSMRVRVSVRYLRKPPAPGILLAARLTRTTGQGGLEIDRNPEPRRCTMKAGIYFTGTGPILLLTTYDQLNDPLLVNKLEQKGIKKFIAYEVPEALVKEKYGLQFNIIMGDLKQTDDLRVLDYDGHHVFYNFSLAEMGAPVFHEKEASVLKAV